MINFFKNIAFMCLVTGASLSAEAILTPQMEYEFLNKMDITQNTPFSDIIDPIALHTLESVSSNHHTITLSDGSVWTIGYFWRNRLSTWCQNDQLRFSLHLMNSFNLVKIENLHQHSVAWGNLCLRPDIDTMDVVWIVDTYLDSLIELNDGAIFKAMREYSPIQSQWGPGNIMFIVSNDNPDYPYVLWNLTWNSEIPCQLYSPAPISN